LTFCETTYLKSLQEESKFNDESGKINELSLSQKKKAMNFVEQFLT